MSDLDFSKLKFIARDADGSLFIFSHRPIRVLADYEFTQDDADAHTAEAHEIAEFPGSETITFNGGPKELKITVEILP